MVKTFKEGIKQGKAQVEKEWKGRCFDCPSKKLGQKSEQEYTNKVLFDILYLNKGINQIITDYCRNKIEEIRLSKIKQESK